MFEYCNLVTARGLTNLCILEYIKLRLRPFYIIRLSILPNILSRRMSCTPIEVKVIVTIVTSNLISHIMILLAFVIITWLVDNFSVFFIRACRYVRKVALRTGDGKIIQCCIPLFLELDLYKS